MDISPETLGCRRLYEKNWAIRGVLRRNLSGKIEGRGFLRLNLSGKLDGRRINRVGSFGNPMVDGIDVTLYDILFSGNKQVRKLSESLHKTLSLNSSIPTRSFARKGLPEKLSKYPNISGTLRVNCVPVSKPVTSTHHQHTTPRKILSTLLFSGG